MSFWQSTDTDTQFSNSSEQLGKRKRRLGPKLIIQILLANALLSLIASSLQLYVGYNRDRNQLLGSIETIEESFGNGFADALWEYNFPLAQALQEGIFSQSDVQYVILKTDKGRSWVLGEPSLISGFSKTLEFTYTNDAGVRFPVGSLEIGLTLENIEARVWSQIWVLLLSNFTKTICASVIMLVLFERNVGRHLKNIAAQVSSTNWPDAKGSISLDRRETSTVDELDLIVNAIESSKRKSREDFFALKDEIAHRRQVENLLRQKSDELQNANDEQAQFTYAISHDLKSPANTISMLLSELELSEQDNLSKDGREILSDAETTVERMTRLVDDVLAYARTVGTEMKTENVDLNVISNEIVQDLQGELSTHKAEVTISKLPIVCGNPVQLRLLLQNLLSNAIKFRSPDRAPRISIDANRQDDPKWVGIAISDNGIGIEPEFYDKIFGLFQRLHSHSAYPGSGLGLTLCQRIVTNHAGRIEVSSEPGQGTCFSVSFPV